MSTGLHIADNRLELVVTVEVDRANQSIETATASLSGMEVPAPTYAAAGDTLALTSY